MDNKTKMLGTMKEGKLLIKMSLPTVAALLIAALYNVVDAAFVGAHSQATLGLGGLSVALPVQLLLIGIGQLFGMGTAALFSRKMGEMKPDAASQTVGNAIVFILLTGLVLTAVGVLNTNGIMKLMGASDEVLPLAVAYGRIIMMGSILHLFANAGTHIVRAEGSAFRSMLYMSVGTLLNIPLDYLFVLKLDMGVSGAAIATVIGTAVSCVLIASYIFSRKSAFSFGKKSFAPKAQMLSGIAAAGFPGFAIHVLGIAVMLVINVAIKSLGNPALYAVTGVVNRIFGIVVMPICGLMYGVLPIVSYNHGAGNTQRIVRTMRLSIAVATAICAVCCVALMLLAEPIVQAFIRADDPVYRTAVDALRIVNITLPLYGVSILTTGICQGLGEIKPAAVTSVCKNIVLIILIWLLLPRMGFSGIIWAFPIADAVASATAGLILIKTMRPLKRMGEYATAAV